MARECVGGPLNSRRTKRGAGSNGDVAGPQRCHGLGVAFGQPDMAGGRALVDEPVHEGGLHGLRAAVDIVGRRGVHPAERLAEARGRL